MEEDTLTQDAIYQHDNNEDTVINDTAKLVAHSPQISPMTSPTNSNRKRPATTEAQGHPAIFKRLKSPPLDTMSTSANEDKSTASSANSNGKRPVVNKTVSSAAPRGYRPSLLGRVSVMPNHYTSNPPSDHSSEVTSPTEIRARRPGWRGRFSRRSSMTANSDRSRISASSYAGGDDATRRLGLGRFEDSSRNQSVEVVPEPDWEDATAARQWLERYYNRENPFAGSPMYQFLTDCYLPSPPPWALNKTSYGSSHWTKFLSDKEAMRFGGASGHAIIFEPSWTPLYPDPPLSWSDPSIHLMDLTREDLLEEPH